MDVLVTGAARFIGSHVASRHLACGDKVMSIDSLDERLDVSPENACKSSFMSRCDVSKSLPTWLDMDSTPNCSIEKGAEYYATGSRNISEGDGSDGRRN